jgi:hypothetical protein
VFACGLRKSLHQVSPRLTQSLAANDMFPRLWTLDFLSLVDKVVFKLSR